MECSTREEEECEVLEEQQCKRVDESQCVEVLEQKCTDVTDTVCNTVQVKNSSFSQSSFWSGTAQLVTLSVTHLLINSLLISASSEPALRISNRVSIDTRDLEPFHSIEEYRVSNSQYRVSSTLINCDFLSFSPKKSYFKAKNTSLEVSELQTPSSLI